MKKENLLKSLLILLLAFSTKLAWSQGQLFFTGVHGDVVIAHNRAFSNGVHTFLTLPSTFSGTIPPEIWFDKDYILPLISNPANQAEFVEIYLTQVPVGYISEPYRSHANELLLLTAFLNSNGEIINNTFHDLRYQLYRAFTIAEAQPFFNRYKAPGQFYDMFEKYHANNTRIIRFPVVELQSFFYTATTRNPQFQYIKLTPSEVDAYAPKVLETPNYRSRYGQIHKQLQFIFEAYVDVNTPVGISAYDINSLCPPECSDY